MRIFKGRIKSGCSSLIDGSIANFSEMDIGSRVQTNLLGLCMVFIFHFVKTNK